jgi:ATP dependent DNA ligase C terminal region
MPLLPSKTEITSNSAQLAATSYEEKGVSGRGGTPQKIRRTTCPFVNLPERTRGRWGLGITPAVMKTCSWVEPVLVAQIKFTEWTSDNQLRQPVFLDCGPIKRRKKLFGSSDLSLLLNQRTDISARYAASALATARRQIQRRPRLKNSVPRNWPINPNINSAGPRRAILTFQCGACLFVHPKTSYQMRVSGWRTTALGNTCQRSMINEPAVLRIKPKMTRNDGCNIDSSVSAMHLLGHLNKISESAS